MPSRKVKTKIKKLNKGKDTETKEASGEKYEKLSMYSMILLYAL